MYKSSLLLPYRQNTLVTCLVRGWCFTTIITHFVASQSISGLQSDMEKLEGLPVSPFMDRDKVSKPSSQTGFIGFVLLPLFTELTNLFPCLEVSLLSLHETLLIQLPMMFMWKV